MNRSTPGLPVHHQPTPGVHSNSRPSRWWCHPTISSSVVPFSSCPQSFPASESFAMSHPFAWGGQSTGVSALGSVLPKNTQDWPPCSPRDSQESSPTPQFKSINSSALSFLHSPTLTSIHDYWKNHSLTNQDSVLKSRDIILLTKVRIVRAMVFPVVMYCMWELDHKEGWALKNRCFWVVVLENSWESLRLQGDQTSQS